MKNTSLRFILSLIVGVSLLLYTFKYVDVDKTFIFIKDAKIVFLIVSFILLIIAYFIRGFRWMIWERNLKYWDSLKLLLIGFMGNNILPARLGEILRAHCTAQKTAEGYGRTAALASIAIERIIDGIVLSGIGLLGLVFASVNTVLFYSLLSVSILFGLLTCSLVVSIFKHEKIRSFFDRVNRKFPGHLTKFGQEKLNYILDGLLLIGPSSRLIKTILVTILIWGIEIIAYYLIANAVLDGVSIGKSLLFLAVVNFASLFPFTVGGIGAIEGAATAYLVSAGVSENYAMAMVLIQHSYQFAFTTFSGAIFYFTGKYYRIPFIQKENDAIEAAARKAEEAGKINLGKTADELASLSTTLGIKIQPTEDIYLSIVIPAYNEQNRLPKTVLETLSWCKKNVENYELIIVDDGSSDDTPNLGRLFSEQIKRIRIIVSPHMGKGAAVRIGMLNTVGKYVLFMDADGATPLDEISKMISKINNGFDVVIGSRVVQKPDETKIVTSKHRKIIGRTFAGLVNIFAVSGFADTQCGFKMFRREIIKPIFSLQKLDGFAFDVEILHISKNLSLNISEVPVNWINQEGSKVNIVTDSIKMFFDIMRIRWLHRNTGLDY